MVCLHGVNFCGMGSVGLSYEISLISFSGCSRIVHSSICVGSVIVLGLYLLVVPLLVVFPSSMLSGVHSSHLVLYAVVQVWLTKQYYQTKKLTP